MKKVYKLLLNNLLGLQVTVKTSPTITLFFVFRSASTTLGATQISASEVVRIVNNLRERVFEALMMIAPF